MEGQAMNAEHTQDKGIFLRPQSSDLHMYVHTHPWTILKWTLITEHYLNYKQTKKCELFPSFKKKEKERQEGGGKGRKGQEMCPGTLRKV